MTDATEPRTRLSIWAWIRLLAVLALAAVLRLHALGQFSLSIDEGLTAQLVERPLRELIPEMRKIEQLPPLFHLVMHAWVRLPGIDVLANDALLRVPSAMFGVAAVGAMFLLGRRLFGTGAGLAAALLLAISPEQIAQSQNARSYSLFVMLALLSCERFAAMLLPAPRSSRDVQRAAIGLAVSTALMMCTHHFGLTVIVAQACVLLLLRRSMLRTWIIAMTGAAVLCLPWIWVLVRGINTDVGFRPGWLPALGADQFRSIALTYGGTWTLTWTIAVLSAIGFFVNVRRSPVGAWFVLSVFVAGVIVPIVISALWRPVFIARYGLPAHAVLLLGAGAGLIVIGRWIPVLGAVVTIAVVAISLPSAWRRAREVPDWRGVVADLRRAARSSDVIVLPSWYNHFVFDHYRHHGAGSRGNAALATLDPVWCDPVEQHELFAKIRGRELWWIVDSRRTNLPAVSRQIPPEHRRESTRRYEQLELWRLTPLSADRD